MAIINDLETKSKRRQKIWTPDEIDTLKRYYYSVPTENLRQYLDYRSAANIRVKAHELKKKGEMENKE